MALNIQHTAPILGSSVETKTVISTDGTTIAYRRSGVGPPLVIVHGTTGDPTSWPSLPALEQCFTVYIVIRRGRGASGDAPTYAIEREFEDVAAVVDAIGEPVNLLGHSFGALCALEGAMQTTQVRKLVLYEGIPTGVEHFPAPTIPQIQPHPAQASPAA